MIDALGAHLKAIVALAITGATAAVGSIVVLVTSATVLPFVGAVIAAVVAAVSTVWVARRQSSGKIATSEAADLWQESQAMRRELREEAARLRRRVAELESREETLELRVRELESAKAQLETRVRELEAA